MLINPLVSGWIDKFGWNQSFTYTAIMTAAIAIPALVFIKEKPPTINTFKKLGIGLYGKDSQFHSIVEAIPSRFIPAGDIFDPKTDPFDKGQTHLFSFRFVRFIK